MRDKRRSLPDERSLPCHLSTLLLHVQGHEPPFTFWWFYLCLSDSVTSLQAHSQTKCLKMCYRSGVAKLWCMRHIWPI